MFIYKWFVKLYYLLLFFVLAFSPALTRTAILSVDTRATKYYYTFIDMTSHIYIYMYCILFGPGFGQVR